MEERLLRREGESDVISDARLEDRTNLSARYEPPTELSRSARAEIEASGPLEETLVAALRTLVRRRVMLVVGEAGRDD